MYYITDYSLLSSEVISLLYFLPPTKEIYYFSITSQKWIIVSFLLKIQTLHLHLCVSVSIWLQPLSVVTDGSPLLGSISTSFTVPCYRCRCFKRFEVVFLAAERVLVPPGHHLHLRFIFLSSLLSISLKEWAYFQPFKVKESISNSIVLSNIETLQAAAGGWLFSHVTLCGMLQLIQNDLNNL